MYRNRFIAVTLFLTMFLNLFTPSAMTTAAPIVQPDRQDDQASDALMRGGGAVSITEDGKVICQDATSEEVEMMTERDPDLSLQEIYSDSEEMNARAAGLKIILRGTERLENHPQAKQAFLKAAATWESIIQSPITVIADVDFGPTWFGEPFPRGLVGLTYFQVVINQAPYPVVREKLIAGASGFEESALYNSLPAATLPTDIGNTIAVGAPATLFRALGILNPVADPDRERNLGPPPAIGFNSAFSYDFDPSDGIDIDKIDFNFVALHEMGHMLGFFSFAGSLEIFPSDPLRVSIWDLFRFRPGVTLDTFSFAERVQSSGGMQVFFAGGPELYMSTGREDKTGGDGEQPHHWKDNFLTRRYIGIMDPTFDNGERGIITANDLAALDVMGYKIAHAGGNEPVIRSLWASLDGDVLTLAVNAADPQGDIAQAQVKLLDRAGQNIAQTPLFEAGVEGSTEVDFLLTVTNLNSFPTVVKAALTLTDRQGKTSEPVAADFSQGDKGGPVISNFSYIGSKLKLNGRGLSGDLELEINGVIIVAGFNVSGKKAVVKGNASSLNLRSGPNRIRVRNGALWSNIFIGDA